MNITVSELMEKIPYVKLIDIRDNYSYKMGTIPTAINIPYLLLITNPDLYLKRDEEYYIFCEMGHTSNYCRSELESRGYKVYNVVGGYRKYLEESTN